jgi:hypothetical protein
MSETLRRCAVARKYWPSGIIGTSSIARAWIWRAMTCCAGRSGASNQASRSRSSSALVGQPIQPFVPLPRSAMCPAGEAKSSPPAKVKKALQPPRSTGSRETRRLSTVPQSSAW